MESMAANAALQIPKYIILKSMYNSKYLRYYDQHEHQPKFLQFSGPNTEMNPHTKFEIEVAKTARNLVNIRSCYNNKYWTAHGKTNNWIDAKAVEPDEDMTVWSCTLFEPIFVDAAAKTLRLRHVKTGNYVCLSRDPAPHNDCLFIGTSSIDPDQCDLFVAIDWESIIVLPKRIAFKGDNGQYLKAYYNAEAYLAFKTTDITEPYVPNEIIPGPDGTVRIKNEHFKQLWRNNPEPFWRIWIFADADLDSTSDFTLFQPVKISHNVIALRNLGNNMFCKRLDASGQTDCLSAINPDIDVYAHLIVEEPVVERVIYHVKYRTGDAKIYGQDVITLKTEILTNRTTQPNDTSINWTHADARTSKWNSSISLKLGVNMTIKAGVPVIAGVEIKISDDISLKYQWGEAVTSEVEETGSKFSVTVPPMTQMKVTLLATRGHCEVPFSYVQRDTLTNGDVVTSEMVDDGVYTGINSFNFRYETEVLPLPL